MYLFKYVIVTLSNTRQNSFNYHCYECIDINHCILNIHTDGRQKSTINTKHKQTITVYLILLFAIYTYVYYYVIKKKMSYTEVVYTHIIIGADNCLTSTLILRHNGNVTFLMNSRKKFY